MGQKFLTSCSLCFASYFLLPHNGRGPTHRVWGVGKAQSPPQRDWSRPRRACRNFTALRLGWDAIATSPVSCTSPGEGSRPPSLRPSLFTARQQPETSAKAEPHWARFIQIHTCNQWQSLAQTAQCLSSHCGEAGWVGRAVYVPPPVRCTRPSYSSSVREHEGFTPTLSH